MPDTDISKPIGLFRFIDQDGLNTAVDPRTIVRISERFKSPTGTPVKLTDPKSVNITIRENPGLPVTPLWSSEPVEELIDRYDACLGVKTAAIQPTAYCVTPSDMTLAGVDFHAGDEVPCDTMAKLTPDQKAKLVRAKDAPVATKSSGFLGAPASDFSKPPKGGLTGAATVPLSEVGATFKAPKDGITLFGLFYKEGEFVPSDVVTKLSAEDKAKLVVVKS
jgi:hypothetical protein